MPCYLWWGLCVLMAAHVLWSNWWGSCALMVAHVALKTISFGTHAVFSLVGALFSDGNPFNQTVFGT